MDGGGEPAGEADEQAPHGDAEARRVEAKASLGPAAGPVGHPFAPLLLMVPVGAWACSVVFDLASHVASEEVVYARGAFWLLAIGLVLGVLAAVPAAIDLLGVAAGTGAHRVALRQVVALAAGWLAFLASFVARIGDASFVAAEPLAIVLSLLGLGCVLVSVWSAVELWFRCGVRVADEDVQRDTFEVAAPA